MHTERADKLFKRLRGARLDATYEDEMRKLHRVELLIIDDLALHRLEATETSDFYELIVERHRTASTIITSNREPPEILTMMADPLLPNPRWTGCNPRLRTRRRRRVLPAAPETPPRKSGPHQSVGLTGGTIIGHHHHTARDRKQPVPSSWQNGGPITLAGDSRTPAEPSLEGGLYQVIPNGSTRATALSPGHPHSCSKD
ncbi:hypothetical protein MCEL_18720 [Mycolicibacterium celeriflavum]|uniref:IstB-like ATP-binding domain-containing protein n=1 Tax=Mycolicibacterium celeriflavum TaxID=1249101 RepID=A0A7I7RGB5_MYCCF|nr:hypothetical protein MCEL_18720 [Mycolicibacterium celeriflavum]